MGNTTRTRIDYVFAAGKLKDLREQKGFSRADLAKVLGVDKTLIAKWETKKCRPSFENARELSYFFGVDDDYWKLSDESKIFDKGIVYDGHKPEDLILSLNEFKDLKNRIVFLEEKIETLAKHDDELKLKLDHLEKEVCFTTEDLHSVWNKIEGIDSDIAEWEMSRSRPVNNESDTSSEQVVKVLAKLLDLLLFDKEA